MFSEIASLGESADLVQTVAANDERRPDAERAAGSKIRVEHENDGSIGLSRGDRRTVVQISGPWHPCYLGA